MGIKDIFHRDEPSEAEAEAGTVSSPLDVDGQGPVTLGDRTRRGGQGSPDTNQGRTEPMPPTPGDPDPAAEQEPPSLAEMNVGGADPQGPAHPAARPRDVPVAAVQSGRDDPGVAPPADRPGIDPDSTTKLPEGPERPAQAGEGRAQRAPGSLGVSPEQQETDVHSGAARMQPGGGAAPPVQPGDAQEVSVPHEVPAPGTSEQSPIAHGVRAAVEPER